MGVNAEITAIYLSIYLSKQNIKTRLKPLMKSSDRPAPPISSRALEELGAGCQAVSIANMLPILWFLIMDGYTIYIHDFCKNIVAKYKQIILIHLSIHL